MAPSLEQIKTTGREKSASHHASSSQRAQPLATVSPSEWVESLSKPPRRTPTADSSKPASSSSQPIRNLQTSKALRSKVPSSQLPPSLPITEDTKLHFLESLFGPVELTPEVVELRRWARELGIHGDRQADSSRISTETRGIQWIVKHDTIQNLGELPTRRPHSGNFSWIGEEEKGIPKYLYNSKTKETLSAGDKEFSEGFPGYIAVSWTWGRYQDGQKTRHSKGTPWPVPRIRRDITGPERNDLVSRLKAHLSSIKDYEWFWVDVLCINQTDETEKQQEIGKQAEIFRRARGVIAFLWTIDEKPLGAWPLSQTVAGLGNLLSWALTFGEPKNYNRSKIGQEGQYISCDKIHGTRFAMVRGDNWFTSLWALQEIVLAPHTIWMTSEGEICYINGRLLTTRLMAVIIRLLIWAERHRETKWNKARKEARKGLALNSDTPMSSSSMSTNSSDPANVGELVKRSFEERAQAYQTTQHYQPRRRGRLFSRGNPSEDRDTEVTPTFDCQGFVIEAPVPLADDLWTEKRYNEEKTLRYEISQWSSWATGIACIDVAISATRGAILLAGTNRDVFQHRSRETALLAALKVGPGLVLAAENYGKTRHLSPKLMNVLLHEEGGSLFDVAHGLTKPEVIVKGGNDLADAEWIEPDTDVQYLLIQKAPDPSEKRETLLLVSQEKSPLEIPLEYWLGGSWRKAPLLHGGPHLLTGMLPDTASQLNQQVVRTVDRQTYVGMPHNGWHMHDDGILHISSPVTVQVFKSKPTITIDFTPNGTRDIYALKTYADVRNVWKTQPWITALLGKDPRVYFLPLAKLREISPSPSDSRSSAGSKPGEKGTPRTPRLFELPPVKGVVLVAKRCPKDKNELHPPEKHYWYKLGNYVATRGNFRKLGVGNGKGILIGSYEDEKRTKDKTGASCERYLEETKKVFRQIRRNSTKSDDEFEQISYDEIIHNEYDRLSDDDDLYDFQ